MPHVIATILPTEQDARQARELSALLAPFATQETTAHLHFNGSNNQPVELALPVPLVRLLLEVLQEMGKGNGVRITPIPKEFTTQQSADFLSVSRLYLIEELLDKGVLPCRKVGNRRRIRAEDLLRYQEAEEAEIARRAAIMRELRTETQPLGLYGGTNTVSDV